MAVYAEYTYYTCVRDHQYHIFWRHLLRSFLYQKAKDAHHYSIIACPGDRTVFHQKHFYIPIRSRYGFEYRFYRVLANLFLPVIKQAGICTY